MPSITAADVKKLRDATGAGMMDAKKALTEADGDFDKAIEGLRVSGAVKAAKRGEKSASNGLVAVAGNAMIVLNCETDFVAKNDQLLTLAADIATLADAQSLSDVDAVLKATLPSGDTVGDTITATSATMGEKLELGDVSLADGEVVTYLHRRSPGLPPQVGVQVTYTGDDAETARAVAMHVAAMRPSYLSSEHVPEETMESERRVAEAKAREEGKPDQVIPRIVDGRVKAFLSDVVLLEQKSVHDDKITVGKMADTAGVTVTGFTRFEVGA